MPPCPRQQKMDMLLYCVSVSALLLQGCVAALQARSRVVRRYRQGVCEGPWSQLLHDTRLRRVTLHCVVRAGVSVGPQVDVSGGLKATLRRRARLYYPEASDADIEQHVNCGSASGVVRSAMLGAPAAVEAVVGAEQRNVEVTRLASSVRELHEMFLDLSVLLDAQHEELSTIESTVGSTVLFICVRMSVVGYCDVLSDAHACVLTRFVPHARLSTQVPGQVMPMTSCVAL